MNAPIIDLAITDRARLRAVAESVDSHSPHPKTTLVLAWHLVVDDVRVLVTASDVLALATLADGYAAVAHPP